MVPAVEIDNHGTFVARARGSVREAVDAGSSDHGPMEAARRSGDHAVPED
jgi:hypothetical protein